MARKRAELGRCQLGPRQRRMDEDICGFDLGSGWVCAMGSHAGPHTHMMTPEWSSPTCVAQAMSRRYHPRVRREDVAWGFPLLEENL